ncbi:MAG: YkvI family membrane protein [Neisseriaceae bacterium]
MVDSKISYLKVLAYAGTFIAFLIGSGFATGQEVVQYFSGYGLAGLLGILVVLVLFVYIGKALVSIGHAQKFEHGGQIYHYLCGPILGRFFDYFSIVFIYMSFMVMIGGAGATIGQQYQVSPWMGAVVMAVLVAVTVICGLTSIVGVLGKVGPIIVLLTIVLGLAAVAKNPAGLMNLDEVLPQLTILTASSHWFFAALSYVGFCMLWLAGFMSLMGSSARNLKEIAVGTVLGAVGFSLALFIIALGLMANIQLVAGTMVPSLQLAATIHPILASFFFVIVLAGIYTTAVPLLWQAAKRFTGENQGAFRWVTMILSVLGTWVALKVPFDQLINVIYVMNGYIGFVLLFFIVLHSVRSRAAKRAKIISVID